MSSAQAAGEEWNGSETARSIEKLGINPRKTEQNRRAQARFRQRKKVGCTGSELTVSSRVQGQYALCIAEQIVCPCCHCPR